MVQILVWLVGCKNTRWPKSSVAEKADGQDFAPMRLLLLLLLVLPSFAREVTQDEIQNTILTVRECSRCHTLSPYLSPRDHKGWDLTVERMNALQPDRPWSKIDCDRMSSWLAKNLGEDLSWNDEAVQKIWGPEIATGFQVTIDEAAAQALLQRRHPSLFQNASASAGSIQTVSKEAALAALPQEMRDRLGHIHWMPPAWLLFLAKLSGYVALVCMLSLLLTGHFRRMLKRRFHVIHLSLAVTFAVTLLPHLLVFFLQYGLPPSLWLWSGVVATLLAATGMLLGFIRRKLGKVFLRNHIILGYLGTVAVLLHWLWAWI